MNCLKRYLSLSALINMFDLLILSQFCIQFGITCLFEFEWGRLAKLQKNSCSYVPRPRGQADGMQRKQRGPPASQYATSTTASLPGGNADDSVHAASWDNGATADSQLDAALPPRMVIVKFLSRRTKTRVMDYREELKNIDKEKYQRPIYFQDDLTARRAKLAYQARQLKNTGKIVDTWVIDSKVMIKDKHYSVHHIRTQQDISLSLQCKGVFTVWIQLSRTSNASGLIQKRCGSYALAVVRHLFCIKPSVSHFTYCLSCHLTRISLGKEDHSQVNPMRIEIPWGMSCFFLCVLLFQLYYHTALYFKITNNNFVNILLLKRMFSLQ